MLCMKLHCFGSIVSSIDIGPVTGGCVGSIVAMGVDAAGGSPSDGAGAAAGGAGSQAIAAIATTPTMIPIAGTIHFFIERLLSL